MLGLIALPRLTPVRPRHFTHSTQGQIMTTATKLTNRFQTICVTGYKGSVSRDENRAAHGGACLCQARLAKDGRIMGRKVNSNGRHQEIGDAYEIDAEQLSHWESMA